MEPEKKIDEQDRCKCAPAVREKVAVKAESCFFFQLVDYDFYRLKRHVLKY